MKPELEKRYIETGKVKLVWHDFAWIGDESRLAAQGARCAGRQSKFWEFHDHLYQSQRGFNQGQFAATNLKQFAADLKLDGAAFGACLDQAEDRPAIQNELAQGRQQGITATPVFVINGQRLVGAASPETFARAIDAELAKVGR